MVVASAAVVAIVSVMWWLWDALRRGIGRIPCLVGAREQSRRQSLPQQVLKEIALHLRLPGQSSRNPLRDPALGAQRIWATGVCRAGRIPSTEG
jgi:hypothetical protein